MQHILQQLDLKTNLISMKFQSKRPLVMINGLSVTTRVDIIPAVF